MAWRESYSCPLIWGEYSTKVIVYTRFREIALGGGTKLSAEDGFLQFMIERLFQSDAPDERITDENLDEMGDDMKLTSIQSITDFMTCAGRTLPDNIRSMGKKKSCCCKIS